VDCGFERDSAALPETPCSVVIWGGKGRRSQLRWKMLISNFKAMRGKKRTYNRRDSQMVTHSSTSRPVQCLCMAERTGCPVLTDLWSYVTVAVCIKLVTLSLTTRHSRFKSCSRVALANRLSERRDGTHPSNWSKMHDQCSIDVRIMLDLAMSASVAAPRVSPVP
jgi:hypothetical protein